MKALILCFSCVFWFGCTIRTTNPVVVDENTATCEQVRDNLAELPEACGEDLTTFVERCERAVKVEKQKGVIFPRDCLTRAKDCPAVDAC